MARWQAAGFGRFVPWRAHEYTVLMVVDRRGAEVRRRQACRALGRAWGAGGRGGELVLGSCAGRVWDGTQTDSGCTGAFSARRGRRLGAVPPWGRRLIAFRRAAPPGA